MMDSAYEMDAYDIVEADEETLPYPEEDWDDREQR